MLPPSLNEISDDDDDPYVPLISPQEVSRTPDLLEPKPKARLGRDEARKPILKRFPCYFCPDRYFVTERDVHKHNKISHPEASSKYSFKRRKCLLCRNSFQKSLNFRGLISHIFDKKCKGRKPKNILLNIPESQENRSNTNNKNQNNSPAKSFPTCDENIQQKPLVKPDINQRGTTDIQNTCKSFTRQYSKNASAPKPLKSCVKQIRKVHFQDETYVPTTQYRRKPTKPITKVVEKVLKQLKPNVQENTLKALQNPIEDPIHPSLPPPVRAAAFKAYSLIRSQTKELAEVSELASEDDNASVRQPLKTKKAISRNVPVNPVVNLNSSQATCLSFLCKSHNPRTLTFCKSCRVNPSNLSNLSETQAKPKKSRHTSHKKKQRSEHLRTSNKNRPKKSIVLTLYKRNSVWSHKNPQNENNF